MWKNVLVSCKFYTYCLECTNRLGTLGISKVSFSNSVLHRGKLRLRGKTTEKKSQSITELYQRDRVLKSTYNQNMKIS